MRTTIDYRGTIEDETLPDYLVVNKPCALQSNTSFGGRTSFSNITVFNGNVQFSGSVSFVNPPSSVGSYEIVSGSQSITKSFTIVDNAVPITLTLQNSSVVDGTQFIVKKVSKSAQLTISTVAAQKIDRGDTSLIITSQNTTVTFFAANSEWFIV